MHFDYLDCHRKHNKKQDENPRIKKAPHSAEWGVILFNLRFIEMPKNFDGFSHADKRMIICLAHNRL